MGKSYKCSGCIWLALPCTFTVSFKLNRYFYHGIDTNKACLLLSIIHTNAVIKFPFRKRFLCHMMLSCIGHNYFFLWYQPVFKQGFSFTPINYETLLEFWLSPLKHYSITKWYMCGYYLWFICSFVCGLFVVGVLFVCGSFEEENLIVLHHHTSQWTQG